MLKSAQILDAIITAVVVLDDQLRIQFINSAAQDLLQISQQHAEGQALQDIILRADRVIPSLAEALTQRQPYTERDATIRLPNNVSIHVDFSVSIAELDHDQAALVIELQQLNRLHRINKDDESTARQKTTRDLIRGLAHEVKNPLGGIRGAAQLLEQELAEPDLKEYTSVIISEADRLKTLVDRMLGPQNRLHFKPTSIIKVCEHVIRLIDAEQPKVISWDRDYDPSLPDIEADETQIIQAVLNIARNAVEAMTSSQQHKSQADDRRIRLRSRVARRFTIGTTLHRQVLQLDILDNGPGIDPDLAERIFFPMISGRPEGSGLGLSITQNIVAQHHGSIQVESRPGHTCFSLYLPFTQDAAARIKHANRDKSRQTSGTHQ